MRGMLSNRDAKSFFVFVFLFFFFSLSWCDDLDGNFACRTLDFGVHPFLSEEGKKAANPSSNQKYKAP